jgi:hypothetical protein
MQVQGTSRTGNITVLRSLQPVRAAQPTPEVNPSARAVLGTDQLRLSTPAPTQQLPRTAAAAAAAAAPPAPRTRQDYDKIFAWVEETTGKPIAYQTPESKAAYIQSIKGKPQEYYDRAGFLNSLGVNNADTYGRDDSGVHALLKTIDYTPHSHEVSKALQLAQKAFFQVFRVAPKTFDKVAGLVDKYYFTRKDMKAQSWLNMPVPLPKMPTLPLVNPQKIWDTYGNTRLAAYVREGQAIPDSTALFNKFVNPDTMCMAPVFAPQFEEDFHAGVPAPDGHGAQHYGTYALLRDVGFNEEQAARIANANYDMDRNNTAYGASDAFPNALPSKHFNLNKETPEKGDTRFIWAQRHLDAAVELAKRGLFDQAEKELGYGLHGIQDAFAHGHIRLASHAITDNIPDGVDYNPVAAYEASVATLGYVRLYIQRALS